MAGEERLGASFSIDVSDLKAGLAQANRLIKESNSEFKAAAAGMDDWTKSEEGLLAKKKQLNKTLEVQNEVLRAYEQQMKEAGYSADDMSRAAVDLRTKINNQKAAIANTEKQIRSTDGALENLSNSSDDAGGELDDLTKAAKRSDEGFTVMKGTIAGVAAQGIGALAGACTNLIGNLMNTAQATEEYAEDMGKLETAFETANLSTELATETYKNFYSALGESDRSVEAVNHLAKFVETEEDMAKWTDICTGVWGAYGDSLPIEGLTEAANETIKTGEVTGVLADALNWAGISQDEFQTKLDECSSEQERNKLITETLSETYQEHADNYKENNEAIIEARQATSDYADAQKSLGDAIRPLTTDLTNMKTQGLQWFVETGLPFLQNNLPAIATLVGGVTAAVVAQTAANKIKMALDLAQASGVSVLTLAQQGLNAAMAANPIGFVITLIAALVAAFMMLWTNCESFRNFWLGLWDGLKNIAGSAIDAIKGFVTGIPSFFSEKFQQAYDLITTIFGNLPAFFAGLWQGIKNSFSYLGTAIGDAISGAVRTAINGVIAFIEDRINSAIGIINGAIDLINALPGVSVGHVPYVGLPRLARGGVVNEATAAIIGEDGAEAVVPLEKNTEWLEKVADLLAAKTGGGGVVVNQTNNYSQAHSRYEIYKSKQATAAAVRLAMKRG